MISWSWCGSFLFCMQESRFQHISTSPSVGYTSVFKVFSMAWDIIASQELAVTFLSY